MATNHFERLQCQVIKMFGTRTFGIEMIIAGRHSAERARVCLIVRIEKQQTVDLLEQGIVCRGRHGSGINIFARHLFISFSHGKGSPPIRRVGKDAGAIFTAYATHLLISIQLSERNLFDSRTVFGSFPRIGGGERFSIGCKGDGLGRVDSEINPLLL